MNDISSIIYRLITITVVLNAFVFCAFSSVFCFRYYQKAISRYVSFLEQEVKEQKLNIDKYNDYNNNHRNISYISYYNNEQNNMNFLQRHYVISIFFFVAIILMSFYILYKAYKEYICAKTDTLIGESNEFVQSMKKSILSFFEEYKEKNKKQRERYKKEAKKYSETLYQNIISTNKKVIKKRIIKKQTNKEPNISNADFDASDLSLNNLNLNNNINNINNNINNNIEDDVEDVSSDDEIDINIEEQEGEEAITIVEFGLDEDICSRKKTKKFVKNKLQYKRFIKDIAENHKHINKKPKKSFLEKTATVLNTVSSTSKTFNVVADGLEVFAEKENKKIIIHRINFEKRKMFQSFFVYLIEAIFFDYFLGSNNKNSDNSISSEVFKKIDSIKESAEKKDFIFFVVDTYIRSLFNYILEKGDFVTCNSQTIFDNLSIISKNENKICNLCEKQILQKMEAKAKEQNNNDLLKKNKKKLEKIKDIVKFFLGDNSLLFSITCQKVLKEERGIKEEDINNIIELEYGKERIFDGVINSVIFVANKFFSTLF